ncbi:MAG: DUF1552 domain-containing protein [Myxococcota bacterium]|nr:DUF1552 domain-containing protein [Myxococcota bacterium]
MPYLSRRRLLATGASSILAAPFVRLLGSPARATTELSRASRLLVFFTPNGTIHNHWRPAGGESDFSFPAGSMLEALTPHRDQLLVLDGMDFSTGSNHEGGMAAMLTAGGTTSIDQVVADHIGGDSRFASLELGAQTSLWGGSVQTRMCYRDGTFVTPDDSPHNVFDRMFGDVGDPVLLARRQRLLDINRAEINDLRGRLGLEERHLLDAHLEGLDAVERAISGDSLCESPMAPAYYDPMSNDNFPLVAQHQMDLAVQALACGMTNVVTLQLSHTVGPTVFSWLGQTEGHHSLSHAADTDTTNVANFVACERWYAEQFAYLLDQLSATLDPAGGGSMLDTTVVLWAQELGDGRMHTCESVPWVIAGTGGGFFRSGRALDLAGATHDGVLTSVAHAFGLELESFGTGTAGPVAALR